MPIGGYFLPAQQHFDLTYDPGDWLSSSYFTYWEDWVIKQGRFWNSKLNPKRPDKVNENILFKPDCLVMILGSWFGCFQLEFIDFGWK